MSTNTNIYCAVSTCLWAIVYYLQAKHLLCCNHLLSGKLLQDIWKIHDGYHKNIDSTPGYLEHLLVKKQKKTPVHFTNVTKSDWVA